MIKHGRKQKLKTAAEEDLLYAKHWYCYLRNGKAVRKIKKQLNRRYRKEMQQEDTEEYVVLGRPMLDMEESEFFKTEKESLAKRMEKNLES